MGIKSFYFLLVLVIFILAVGWEGRSYPVYGNFDNNAYGHGANHSGPYNPSGAGLLSGNGSATGKHTGEPAAGTVGTADTKNPQGQYPNGSDNNAGYECDRNQGIGQTNPAHSGCQEIAFVLSPTPTPAPTQTPTPGPTATTTPTESGPTPTSTPSSGGSSTSSSSSNSSGSSSASSQTPSGSVLGVSTLANTGGFLNSLGQSLQLVGAVLALTGLLGAYIYRQRRTFIHAFPHVQ